MSVPIIRFKPAFNPYTEPSMEVFSWRYSLEKWVELGNLGVLRTEILEVTRLDPGICRARMPLMLKSRVHVTSSESLECNAESCS